MNTIIIYDLDDGIFPTTWVLKNNNLEIFDFTQLDNIIYNLLYTSIKLGYVIIVSNCLPIWYNKVLQVLPKTKYIIEINKIPIRYSRLETTSNNYMLSKVKTFNNIYNNIKSSKKHLNIISIGDSMPEFIALIQLSSNKQNKYLKTIRMKEKPSYDEIIHQLNLLYKSLNSIIYRQKNMDLLFV